MKKTIGAITAASALALALAGCGSNSLSQPAPTQGDSTAKAVAVNADLAAKVPDNIRSAGVLQIGTDATYKPNEYMSGTEVVGWEVELFDDVAATLDLKTKWNPADFSTILTGITAGKYDVGVSSFTINAERLKQVTFVQYANVGTQWVTLTGNPKGVDPAQPCGKTIAVQTGTVQDDEMTDAQAGCGANQINLLRYTGQDEVNNALSIGKADAMLADYPVAQNAIQTAAGKMAALGEQYGAAPYGAAFKHENLVMAEAVSGALTDLKESGRYQEILAKYGIEAAAVTSFEINPTIP